MNDREALNKLSMDIVRMSRRQNKILTVFLILSVVLNLLLASMLFQLGTTQTETYNPLGGAVVVTALAKKPSEHIATRQKLKDIAEVKTFEELLERCILTDEEKFILREHYLRGRGFVSIAMEIGYSEDAVKHKHQKILKKIRRIM